MSAGLPITAFTEAKRDLSNVMSGVVREHRPSVIKRGSGERMLLLDEDAARRLLERYRFETDVTSSQGAVTVHVRSVGVLGHGGSFDEAIDDAVANLRRYAERYFARPGFYAQTSRARHEPWLLRLALTPEAEHRSLLTEPPA